MYDLIIDREWLRSFDTLQEALDHIQYMVENEFIPFKDGLLDFESIEIQCSFPE